MTQPASVLVLGSDGVGKFALVRGLRASPITRNEDGVYQLTLDTKYYTADVLLCCVDPEYTPNTDYEALVLVFDAFDPSTFDAVRSWSESHDVSRAEVKLVVANKVDKLELTGSVARQPWLDDAISWCCDNAFEFVEAAADKPSVDTQLHLDAEMGVPRVLAALQAHAWPGLINKGWAADHSSGQFDGVHCFSSWRMSRQDEEVVRDQGSTAAAATGAAADAAVQQEEDRSLLEANCMSLPAAAALPGMHPTCLRQRAGNSSCATPPAMAPGGNKTSSSSSNMQWWQQQHQQHQCKHQCELHAQQEQEQRQQGFAADCPPGLRDLSAPPDLSCAAAATPPASSGGDANVAAAAAAAAADDDDDHSFPGGDLDDFDLMMAEMTGVRARLAGLPDAERRAAAAELALQLAAMMGLDGDDDENDSTCDGYADS